MDNKIIDLKYRRTDFEEIYYRNGGDKTFLNNHLKKQRNTFIIVGIAFVVTLLYILSIRENYGFLVFIGVLVCFAFFDWYQKALPGIKWKREVKNYLDGLDKIGLNQISLTSSAFTLVQDKKETIEKWTEFKRAEIEESFISLLSNTTTYLIPKKSMTPDEFEFLRKIFAEKIKNEL